MDRLYHFDAPKYKSLRNRKLHHAVLFLFPRFAVKKQIQFSDVGISVFEL